jgi:hypothetical protein
MDNATSSVNLGVELMIQAGSALQAIVQNGYLDTGTFESFYGPARPAQPSS